MRLWSVHPRDLDRQGLTAAWREALLAQAVLAGRTKGYTRHPQLERFRATSDPHATIGAFLAGIRGEASARGYAFDPTRIEHPPLKDASSGREAAWAGSVPVSQGQLAHEWVHLMAKLTERSRSAGSVWSIREVGRRVPSSQLLANNRITARSSCARTRGRDRLSEPTLPIAAAMVRPDSWALSTRGST